MDLAPFSSFLVIVLEEEAGDVTIEGFGRLKDH